MHPYPLLLIQVQRPVPPAPMRLARTITCPLRTGAGGDGGGHGSGHGSGYFSTDAWEDAEDRQDYLLQDLVETARVEAARLACGGKGGSGSGGHGASSSTPGIDGLSRLDPYIWQPLPPGTVVVNADQDVIATDENGGLVCACKHAAQDADQIRWVEVMCCLYICDKIYTHHLCCFCALGTQPPGPRYLR
jgi:hypothetical protein